MRFSEMWLREWVQPEMSTRELADLLTMAGLEVDAVEPVAGEFSGVVVGQVREVVPHPDADKLRVCTVEVGGDGPLTIVCGAANVRAGMKAPAALVGARLPGGLVIKHAKLRGVASSGMLCSAQELGLAETSSGLLELAPDSPVGADLRAVLALDDVSIELGLTPNRGDCLSVAGVAREVAALSGCDLGGPAFDPVVPVIDQVFPVAVEAAAGCPRYLGRVVRGVDVNAQTPVWMKERLRRSGLRSLGPVVDVTNYVLLELGQPMHAFDLACLTGGIRVRHAQEGEKLALLNGTEVTLDAQDLVIADERGAVALAGVMGGAPTAVGEQTRDIFFESAYFSPATIAGRARRHGLHTDSSHRFERGVDPELQRRAIERATALLLAMAGGQAGPVVEVVHAEHLPARPAIGLRAQRLERLLGVAFAAAQVESILRRLHMQAAAVDGGWQVVPPGFRFDIALEQDLIEEVARVSGYSNLPSTLPIGPMAMSGVSEAEVPLARLREVLVERGYQEAITYSFVDPVLQRRFDPERAPLALANPISADLAVMRTGLWPGLVQALIHNVNRQQGRVRLFESGLRFIQEGGQLRQERMIGGLAYGAILPEQWGSAERAVDFYDAKGDVEALIALTRRADVAFAPARHPALHPGQSARVSLGGEELGWIGALHPQLQQALEIPGKVFLFELRLEVLQGARLPRFAELSRFPAIRRDIAVVVARDLPAERLVECVRRAAPPSLRELKLFDVYAGERIDSGRKSVALGLTLQEQSRTLTDGEVDTAIAKVVQALREELGATLRE